METDIFDNVAGVLQVDTLAPYLFIICQDYALQTVIDLIKYTGFTLKKARSGWYLAQTIMDADYADDIALFANAPAQAESLLHTLGQAAGDMALLVNANKTEYMRFNQERDSSCPATYLLSLKPSK